MFLFVLFYVCGFFLFGLLYFIVDDVIVVCVVGFEYVCVLLLDIVVLVVFGVLFVVFFMVGDELVECEVFVFLLVVFLKK